MNLPRLSEELVTALRSEHGWAKDTIRAIEVCVRKELEQWMREQKPAAYCRPDDPQNSTAFAWPGTDREEGHLAPLYAAPVPASQGDGELRRLILSAEAHRKDRDWELMILDLREAATLSAPVTTKEAEG